MSPDMGHEARQQRRQVIVVGGGVIGLSAGLHLAREGLDVCVLDTEDFGAGASWGNAGWVVPSLVHPFNAPKAVSQSLRAMLRRRSPIALRRVPSSDLAVWSIQFWRASRAERSEASLRRLAQLASSATASMQRLADELGFECHSDGLLVPFRTEQALDDYLTAHRLVEAAGYTGRVERLSATAVREREPALGHDVAGGLYFLDEMSVRPDSVTAAMVRGIASAGGETANFERVRTITPVSRRRWRVRTTRRTLVADAVVVAAGERTAQLVLPLGVRLPLQPGRGCSVLLEPGQLTLRQPLKIAEHRVACTPFDNGQVRISGTFDLTPVGAGPAVGRMRSVLRSAGTHLPALVETEIDPAAVWAGARPCTPDSIPRVEHVDGKDGLVIAAGHGTLGVTLAPETGRRVADLVQTSLKSPA